MVCKMKNLYYYQSNFKLLDTLHSTIKEITEIGNKEGIDYFFALTRRKLGNITLKHMPVSCIGILNFDGAQVLKCVN